MVDTEDPEALLGTYAQAAREARSGIAEHPAVVHADTGGVIAEESLAPSAEDERVRELSLRRTRNHTVYTGSRLGKSRYKWVFASYAQSDQRYVLCNYRGEPTHAGASGVTFGSIGAAVAKVRANTLAKHQPPYMSLDEYMAMRVDAHARLFPNTDREKSLLLMQLMSDLFMEPRTADGILPGIDLPDPMRYTPEGEAELNLFKYHVCRRRLHLAETKEDTIAPVYPFNWQTYSQTLPARLWGNSATYADKDARRQQRPFVRILPLWAISTHESADAAAAGGVIDHVEIAARGIITSEKFDGVAYANRTMPMGILMFEWHISDEPGAPRVHLPNELAAVFTELGYTIFEMPRIMGRQVNAAATIPNPTTNDAFIAYYLLDCGLDAAHHRSLVPICIKLLPGDIGIEPAEVVKPPQPEPARAAHKSPHSHHAGPARA